MIELNLTYDPTFWIRLIKFLNVICRSSQTLTDGITRIRAHGVTGMRSRMPAFDRLSRPCRLYYSRPHPVRRSEAGSSKTSLPRSNWIRPVSTCGENGDYFNGDTDATAFAVNVNNFWLIDFVLCSQTQTPLFKTTLLIQAFYNLFILYFTRNTPNVEIAMTYQWLTQYIKAIPYDLCGI